MENVSLFAELANEVKKLREEIEILKSKKSMNGSEIKEWIEDNPTTIVNSIDLENEIESGIRGFFIEIFNF